MLKQPAKNLTNLVEKQYADIVDYYLTGRTKNEILPEHQETLDRWRIAASILRQFPVKSQAVKRYRLAVPDITERQAYNDINAAAHLWAVNNKYDRDFVEAWFLNKLFEEIINSEDETARSRNLATLGKYLDKLPPERIDPKLMEQNTFNIQVNFGTKTITLTEADIQKLPKSLSEKIISSVPDEISEEQAADIINS